MMLPTRAAMGLWKALTRLLQIARVTMASAKNEAIDVQHRGASANNEAMDVQLLQRLQATEAKIAEICSISGNAGLSVGVLHEGNVVYRANFGYRDAEAKIAPDSNTVYHVGSLTKFITSAALAVLVEKGTLSWESRLLDILPGFHQKDREIEEKANVTDLLSHRLALEMRVPYWAQMHNQLLLPASEGLNVLGALEPTGKFRKDVKYNNWAYGAAGDLIEKLSGESLEAFVKHYLTDPLKLERTTMGKPTQDNYAKSYMCWNDGTLYEVPAPALESGKIIAGAGALKSSVEDMIVLYGNFLDAAAHQKETNSTSTPSSPFYQTSTILSPHITKNVTSYGLGWFLVDFPGEIGWVGINDSRVKKMPIIARGTQPRKIAYHNGSMPGALSSVHIIPESRTAVVVLANSIPFSDVPDWVGGILLEAILDTPEPNDFVALAEEARATSIAKYKATAEHMEKTQEKGTAVKPLNQYTGKYYNDIGNYLLDVSVNGNGLRMRVQGFDETCYDLYHYQHDTFAWKCDREVEMQMVMYPSWYEGMHKIHFASGQDDGSIDRIIWSYARDVPGLGETFMKSKDVVHI